MMEKRIKYEQPTHLRKNAKASGFPAERKRGGFTLAELLIVVAVIAVLIAVAIPVFNASLEKSREAVDLSNLRSAYSVARTAIMFEELEEYDRHPRTVYTYTGSRLVKKHFNPGRAAGVAGKAVQSGSASEYTEDLPDGIAYNGGGTDEKGQEIEVLYLKGQTPDLVVRFGGGEEGSSTYTNFTEAGTVSAGWAGTENLWESGKGSNSASADSPKKIYTEFGTAYLFSHNNQRPDKTWETTYHYALLVNDADLENFYKIGLDVDGTKLDTNGHARLIVNSKGEVYQLSGNTNTKEYHYTTFYGEHTFITPGEG